MEEESMVSETKKKFRDTRVSRMGLLQSREGCSLMDSTGTKELSVNGEVKT